MPDILLIPFKPVVIILIGIIAQGFFASILVGTSPLNKKANFFLATLLLTFALWLFDTFYKAAGLYQKDPNFYFQPIFYSFAFGPLMYFYVKRLTNAAYQFKSWDSLHFLPALIQGGLYWFLFLKDYSFRRWFWQEVHYPFTYNLEFDLTLLSLFCYIIASIFLLRNYRLWLENNFSEFSKINLNWLWFILIAMGSLCFIWGVDVFLRDVLDIYRNHNLSEIIMGVLLLLLAFGGIRQNNMAHVFFQTAKPKKTESETELESALITKIKYQMEISLDYLEPGLTLQQFSKALKEPARKVSQHINQGLNSSFVDFVNQYRVEAMKAKIQAGQLKQHTLLALALESGFNSKSTFNRVFKKQTGMSPKEYVSLVEGRME